MEIKSTGTKADIKSNVKMGKIYSGYFSSKENVDKFIELGIIPIESILPDSVEYIDLGGGEGFLTKGIKEYLESKGKSVKELILDANQTYLEKAKALGVKTSQCNLQESETKNIDLLTMRSVLQYNSLDVQKEILKRAYSSLKKGGCFVNQLNSSSKENCSLRAKMNNLPSLHRGSGGIQFSWISEKEYLEILEEIGFKENKINGYGPPCSWTIEEQWKRFNPEGSEQDKKVFVEQVMQIIENSLKSNNLQELGLEKEGNTYRIHYKFPIIISKK